MNFFKKKKVCTKCENCIFGKTNFWNYMECYAFPTNNRLDWFKTEFTAKREEMIKIYNSEEKCPFYQKKNLFKLILQKCNLIEKD